MYYDIHKTDFTSVEPVVSEIGALQFRDERIPINLPPHIRPLTKDDVKNIETKEGYKKFVIVSFVIQNRNQLVAVLPTGSVLLKDAKHSFFVNSIANGADFWGIERFGGTEQGRADYLKGANVSQQYIDSITFPQGDISLTGAGTINIQQKKFCLSNGDPLLVVRTLVTIVQNSLPLNKSLKVLDLHLKKFLLLSSI